MWASYRMAQDSAQSDREREFNKSFYKRLIGGVLGFFVIYGALMFCGGSLVKTHPPLFIGLTTGAYSSIFIASPVLAMLKEREPRYANIRARLASRAQGAPLTPALSQMWSVRSPSRQSIRVWLSLFHQRHKHR